jgi:hypothetical protein
MAWTRHDGRGPVAVLEPRWIKGCSWGVPSMRRFLAVLCLLAALSAGCQSADTAPQPSVPPAPIAPAGWVSLGSGGTSGVGGMDGLVVQVSGRPLALSVACTGNGTLVVVYGRDADSRLSSTSGEDAIAFDCQVTPGTPQRREIGDSLGAGPLTVLGGIVPGHDETGPTAYMLSVEEQLP